MKRHNNLLYVNRQLRHFNSELTEKLDRMKVVKDYELFSMSSEESI